MIRMVYRIDKNNLYVEDVEITTTAIPSDCVSVHPNDPIRGGSFFKHKWEVDHWVEGLSQTEIDIITGDTLESAKQNKLNELNESCNKAILGGFNHTVNGIEYHFNFDYDAQLNFQGSRSLLIDGLISTIEWTVTRDGVYERIIIDKTIMDELTIKILQHKDSNIKHLRNELMPLVESASKDELDKIVW